MKDIKKNLEACLNGNVNAYLKICGSLTLEDQTDLFLKFRQLAWKVTL
jgi:hypothetical protein